MRQRDSVWQALAARGDFAVNTWAVIDGTRYDTITAPVISGGLLSGDKLSVGNCISSTLKFTVMTTNEIPKSAEVVIWSQLTDGLENGLVSQPMEMGTFWINRRTVNDDLVDLECYDAMMAGNQPYADDSAGLNWPKPMKTVVERCAEQMNVEIDDRTTILPETEYKKDYSVLVVEFDTSTTYKLFAYSYGGTVTVDWGDGTQETLRSSQSATMNTHTYSAGRYSITLTPSDSSTIRFYKPSWRADNQIDNNLKELYVGNRAYIYSNAFTQSYVLNKVLIASNVNPRIESEAFCYCSVLEQIVLPSSITYIGNYAFEYCPLLAKIYVQSSTPPTIGGSSILSNSSIAMFYVPTNKENVYKTAWSAYSNKIVGYSSIDYDYGDYVVTKPNDDDTLLDILKRIGEIHGGNWIITPENKLRLVPLAPLPSNTSYIVDNVFNHITTDDGYSLIWEVISSETESSGEGSDDEFELVNVPVVIGNIETAKSYIVSKITMTIKPKEGQEDVTAYVAGDDSGYNLIIEQNPYATQDLCNQLMVQLRGLTYAPYTVTGACFDPCAEYGDWIVVSDKVRSVLYNQTQRFDINYRSDISAPGKDEVEDEYPFMTPTQKMQYEIVGVQKDADVLKTQIEQTNEYISANVIKNGEVRSRFAMEDGEITIDSGKIRFLTNTLTVEAKDDDTATNFTLTEEGKMTCRGATMMGDLLSISKGKNDDNVTLKFADGRLSLYRYKNPTGDDDIYDVTDKLWATIYCKEIAGTQKRANVFFATEGQNTLTLVAADTINDSPQGPKAVLNNYNGAITISSTLVGTGDENSGRIYLNAAGKLSLYGAADVNLRSRNAKLFLVGKGAVTMRSDNSTVDIEGSGNVKITSRTTNITLNAAKNINLNGTIYTDSRKGITASGWTWGSSEGAVYLTFKNGLLVDKTYGPVWH